MKRQRAIILSLLMFLPVLAFSQSIKRDHALAEIVLNTTYANSTIDTSGAFYPGAWDIVSLRAATLDSTNIRFVFDKRAKGQTTWTAVSSAAGDTLVQVGGAGAANPGYDIILRNGATDRIGGATTQYRVRAISLATGNGVTTPSYVVRIEYSK